MTNRNDRPADYPNGTKFQQLAIDTAETQYELEQIELWYRTEQLRYKTAKIAGFAYPEPVNVDLYMVRKQMLEHRLQAIAHESTTLLIWQAQQHLN